MRLGFPESPTCAVKLDKADGRPEQSIGEDFATYIQLACMTCNCSSRLSLLPNQSATRINSSRLAVMDVSHKANSHVQRTKIMLLKAPSINDQ